MSAAPTPEVVPLEHRGRTARTLTVGRADLLAFGGITALTIVFFGRVLLGNQALYWGDTIMSFYPAHDLWRRSVLAGQLPLWNPHILGGLPFLADAEFSALYPSMILNLFLPLHRALAVDLALHVLLFGMLTYAFLREKRLSSGAAFVGAVTMAFSGFVAVRITQPSLLRSLAWMPLLLLVVERFVAGSRGWRAAPYVGVILALQVLGGHLQTVLLSSLFAVTYGLWLSISFHRRVRGVSEPILSVTVVFILGALLALALAAVQVLPGVELVMHSDRAGGSGLRFAASFSLPLRQIPMLLSPKLFGSPGDGLYWGEWLYWEMVGYFGVAAIVLAVLGFWCSSRRDRVFWGLMAFLGVALALGSPSPVYRLAYWFVPGVAYFRVPARFLLWYGWGVMVLAAYGIEWLQSAESVGRRWRAVASGLVVLGALWLYWAADGPGVTRIAQDLSNTVMRSSGYLPRALYADALSLVKDVTIREGRRVAALWIGAALLVFLARSRRLNPRLLVSLLAVLVLADLFSYGMNFYPTVVPSELVAPPRTTRLLDLERGKYRILTTPTFFVGTWARAMTFSFAAAEDHNLETYRSALVPNIAAQWQIPNAWGYIPIALRRPLQFMVLAISQAEKNGGRSPLLDFMGTKYILTRANLGRTYVPTYSGAFNVWRNDDALPRGYLVTRYKVQPNDELLPQELVGGWDPRRVVILDRRPDRTYGLRDAANPGVITRRAYQPNRLSFDLAITAPSIFVLSDAYYPGWKAYINGVEHPIYRANYAFRAVFLPADARSLEFVFRPRSVVVGGVVSVVSWSALVVVFLIATLHRRRPQPDIDHEGGTMPTTQERTNGADA